MPASDFLVTRSREERLRSAQDRTYSRLLARRGRAGGDPGEAVPVAPNRPLDLSGGAAATLEFDE